ncbi:bacteriophage tail protein [Staphylococcus aureus]|nr:bacteriophage tail protein [Staphylococcus aureus]
MDGDEWIRFIQYEILPKPKGARDVIIQKGDLVKIDMQAKSVVINEEPMLSENRLEVIISMLILGTVN